MRSTSTMRTRSTSRTSTTSPRLRSCSKKSLNVNSEEDNVNLKDDKVNLEDNNASSEDDNANSEDENANSEEDSVNSEDDNAKSEEDSVNSEDDNASSEEDSVNSEDSNAGSESSGEGLPRNMRELGVLLGYIKKNPEEFEIKDIEILKELFLGWRHGGEDISEERFKMYGHFMAARDAIRGSSDTEDEEYENEDDSGSDTKSEED